MENIQYPATHRRLRSNPQMRELTSSIRLSHHAFIQPLFVEESITSPRDIKGLSDIQVETRDSILHAVENNLAQGIQKFLLFPIPATKSERNFNYDFAASIVKLLKSHFDQEIWLALDVCLCSYTSHGHCGLLSKDHTTVINDASVAELSKYAAVLANAGADCIAPSDIMDGRISSIRTTLDALKFDHVSIMSYAAKFSSQWYGPFRDACHSSPNGKGLKNRKSYQHSPFNPDDALASALRDDREGADILMVKPAGLYTDIIARLKHQTLKPIAAYHVSGEYAAIELLAQQELLNREAAHMETWAALTRSGANIIISYAAKHAKQWIDTYQY